VVLESEVLSSMFQLGTEVDSELLRQPVEKCYCLSVVKVSYGREAVINRRAVDSPDKPTHNLIVYDLKGAWTKSNRDVAFALFDTFIKSKVPYGLFLKQFQLFLPVILMLLYEGGS